jgi:hypothetical protein
MKFAVAFLLVACVVACALAQGELDFSLDWLESA